MNKKFAIVMALFMTLAGCTESLEEEISDLIVIPGCNDDTAVNFDENATNSDACLTELALEQAIMDFMTAVEQGPTDADSSMGITVISTSSEGMDTSTEVVVTPNGMAMLTSMSGEMDMGGMMMPISFMSEQTVIPNPDGTDTTVIHMVHMDETQEFTMDNAVPWSVIVAEMMADDDDHDDDDMDGDHDDDMDGDHDGEDHGDDDMDMGGDMGLGTLDSPNPEDVLEGFDITNSTYDMSLSTTSGYSFSASMEETYYDEDGNQSSMTSTFTFVLDSAFKVTSISVTNDMESMTVTLLSDSEMAGYFDADWSSLATEALPFAVMPMGGDDDHDDHGDDDGHDDHGDDDGHDDHGDDDGHDDHGDDDGHDDHGDDGHDDHGDDDDHDDHGDDDHDDHGDDDMLSEEDMFEMGDLNDDGFINMSEMEHLFSEDHDDHDERSFHCSSTVGGTQDTEIPFSQVNDGTEDCGDGSDEPQDFDSDGTIDNWFYCIDGSNVSMELVNDGTDDCPYGDDENHPDDDGEMEFMMMYFNYSDADSDGVLSADEFTTYYNSINDGPSIEFLFSIMDSDGDGMVTASEYSNYANETTGVSAPMSEDDWNDFVAMFSFMDTNSDGGMDLEEFSALMGSMDDDDDDDDDGPTFICGDGTEIPFDYVNDGEADCDDGADEQQYDTDGNEINWFDCMDGSQVWISQVNDGTEDCSDGDDEAHDDHGDHDDGGHDDDDDDHDGHDHGDHDGHMHGPLDWLIVEPDSMTDMPTIAGDLSNYYAVLSKCTMSDDGDDSGDMMMGMGDAPEMDCGPDIMFTPLSNAGMGSAIMFHDADSSGTLTYGDMVHVSENATSEEWTHVRLYSTTADAYSDENPMMTPGFTGVIGMIALLGAALLTRRD